MLNPFVDNRFEQFVFRFFVHLCDAPCLAIEMCIAQFFNGIINLLNHQHIWNGLQYDALFNALACICLTTILPKPVAILIKFCSINFKKKKWLIDMNRRMSTHSYEMEGANEICCSVNRFDSMLSMIFAFSSKLICGMSKWPIDSVFEL